MKIGIQATCTDFTAHPADIARKCEALGFESMFMPEHPLIPAVTSNAYPAGDGSVPEPYAHMMDPFIGLAMAAAVTNRLGLGTGVCLIPEHHPVTLAKEIATLDYCSGGRFMLGIGAGWLREESEIMGVRFSKRWQITEQYCQAMKEIWTNDLPSYNGEFISFPKIKSFPKPARKPHPPIMIGAGGLMGHSELAPQYERALKTVVSYGDGWAPVCLTPEFAASGMARLKEMCGAAGRDFSTIETTIFFPPVLYGSAQKTAAAYAGAGVQRLVILADDITPGTYENELEKLARMWIV